MVIGSDKVPYRFFIKTLFSLDRPRRLFRIGRIVWARGEPGSGDGYTAMLSAGLRPKPFSWRRSLVNHEWILVVLGLRLHYYRSYSGWIA